MLGGLQAKGEVQKLIVKAQDGALEAQPGRTIMESFEGQVHFAGPTSVACTTNAVLQLVFSFVLRNVPALKSSKHQTVCVVLLSM